MTSRQQYTLILALALVVGACGGGAADTTEGPVADTVAGVATTSPDASPTTTAGPETTVSAEEASDCPQLTAADVLEITGVEVVPVSRGDNVGAGGYCANYSSLDESGAVGINVLSGSDSFEASFPPEGAYLPAEPLSGVGDRAMGFRLIEGYPFSYVVAQAGDRVVVIFSLNEGITDEMMEAMATRALE